MHSCVMDKEDAVVEGDGGWGGTTVGAVRGLRGGEEDASKNEFSYDCLNSSNSARNAAISAFRLTNSAEGAEGGGVDAGALDLVGGWGLARMRAC